MEYISQIVWVSLFREFIYLGPTPKSIQNRSQTDPKSIPNRSQIYPKPIGTKFGVCFLAPYSDFILRQVAKENQVDGGQINLTKIRLI